MPHLYVAWHLGIHSDSSIPMLSKKPRSQGVEPSPTPMMPTVGDSTTVISTPCSIRDRARIIAVIHPADPPPTTTIRRTVGGSAERRFGSGVACVAEQLYRVAAMVIAGGAAGRPISRGDPR